MIRFAAALVVLAASRVVSAQASDSTPADTVFVRAQRLVSEGRGDSARALVAGELKRAVPGSPHYIEALYWHAAFAATAADAERDLQRIVVEFPLSAWADDALLRLAQLEVARTERAQAARHLERLLLEHPASPLRARAAFTLARLYFDQNQLPRGCARLEDAARSVSPAEVELRNQVDYLRQRCAGVDTTAASVAAGGVAARQPAGATPGAGAAAGGPPPKTESRAPPVASPQPNPAPAIRPPRADSGASTAAARASGRYTVQVAAVKTPEEAEQMRQRLASRGYDARVYASGSYWRVRVGRYDTPAAAAAALARMRERGLTGFVVEAEPR